MEPKKAFVNSIKLAYGCQNPNCQSQKTLPSYCLDFHHVNPGDKEYPIGRHNGRSVKGLVIEINKCTVLCKICHAMEYNGDLDATGFRKCNLDSEGKILDRL